MIYRAEQHSLCLEDIANEKSSTITETLINDHKSFYSGERLTRIGLGFGLGALLVPAQMTSQNQQSYSAKEYI